MKKFLMISLVITIIGYTIINNVLISKASYDNNKNNEEYSINSNLDASYVINKRDNKAISQHSDDIIIGTIKSAKVDYLITEDESNHQLTGRFTTTGNLEIKKVFKGDLKEGTEIPFFKKGETLLTNADDMFFKELTEEQIKEYNYDKSTSRDISVEINKTYLIFLYYNETTGKYIVLWEECGIREVRNNIFDWILSIFRPIDYTKCKVKNNGNGKFEKIDTILPMEYL